MACLLLGCLARPNEPAPRSLVLHRLNRSEYDRTVAALFNTQLRPAADFPEDETSFGFDNIADVLSLSPALLGQYDGAAKILISELLGDRRSERIEGEELDGPSGAAYQGLGWRIGSGRLDVPIAVDRAGTYRVTLVASPFRGGDLPVLEARFLGETLVRRVVSDRARIELEVTTASTKAIGRVELSAASSGSEPASAILDFAVIEGPLEAPRGPGYARIFTCRPDDEQAFATCTESIVRRFARRALRRPPDDDEVSRWARLAQAAYDEGETFEESVALAIEAILISPKFLFRVEPAGIHRPIDPFSLASRLSFFVTGGPPDDRLIDLAESGMLSVPETLAAEIDRLLENPTGLTESFAGQWLGFRSLDPAIPTRARSDLDPDLAAAMTHELELFFETLLIEDRAVEDLLLLDSTFVNQHLSTHYGLTPTSSSAFERVGLGESLERRGILGKAGWLALTSHADRTSPVRRGKWVLTELLCNPPPPPPPGVPPLVDSATAGRSLREQLEVHRRSPRCAGCHDAMDPIGLALERFDMDGRLRFEVGGLPIDTTGQLPEGEWVTGAIDLSESLASRTQLRRCVAEKLFVFALGRGPSGRADREDLDDIAGASSWRELVKRVVLSAAFSRARR